MRAERVSVLDLVSSSRSLRPQLSVRRFLLLFRFLSLDCARDLSEVFSIIGLYVVVFDLHAAMFFLDFFWGCVTGFHARNEEFGDLAVKYVGNPWFCSSSINFLNLVMGETGRFMVKVVMSAFNFLSSSLCLCLYRC